MSVIHYLSSENSFLEYLHAAAAARSTTTIVSSAAAIQTLCIIDKARSVQVPIHSLEKQKVASVGGLIILVSVCIVHTISHI